MNVILQQERVKEDKEDMLDGQDHTAESLIIIPSVLQRIMNNHQIANIIDNKEQRIKYKIRIL